MFETIRDNVYSRFLGRALVLAMRTLMALFLLTIALGSLACFGLAAYARAELPLPDPHMTQVIGGQLAVFAVTLYVAVGWWPVPQIGDALCVGTSAFLRFLRKGIV